MADDESIWVTSMTMFNRFRISSDFRSHFSPSSIRPKLEGRRAVDEDVLRDREVRAKVDLLVHRVDPELLRGKRGESVCIRLPSSMISPVILLVHSGKNLDQRGLSGDIPAHDSVDLSLEKAEVKRLRKSFHPPRERP